MPDNNLQDAQYLLTILSHPLASPRSVPRPPWGRDEHVKSMNRDNWLGPHRIPNGLDLAISNRARVSLAAMTGRCEKRESGAWGRRVTKREEMRGGEAKCETCISFWQTRGHWARFSHVARRSARGGGGRVEWSSCGGSGGGWGQRTMSRNMLSHGDWIMLPCAPLPASAAFSCLPLPPFPLGSWRWRWAPGGRDARAIIGIHHDRRRGPLSLNAERPRSPICRCRIRFTHTEYSVVTWCWFRVPGLWATGCVYGTSTVPYIYGYGTVPPVRTCMSSIVP